MHSDDYIYFLRGIHWKSTIYHYIHWSGRLFADFISRILLSTDNHLFISLTNTFGHLSLIYLITKLAYRKTNINILSFILLFTLYRIANPSLGQTTFWVVGNANYMWTNVLICFFLLLFLEKKRKKEDKIFPIIITCFFGLLAGITNENTSLTLFLITFAYGIQSFIKSRKKTLLLYSFFVLGGSLILLLSPGNFIRLENFHERTNLPFYKKISIELYTRLPKIFSHFRIVLLFLAGLSSSTDKQNKDTVIFVLASICASLAFIGSPGLPDRSMNGTLVFLLIGLSFSLKEFLARNKNNKHYIAFITLLLVLFYFIPSYFNILRSYKALFRQGIIRHNIILQAKEQKKRIAYIPRFYGINFIKQGDMIDQYSEPHNIAKYLGYTGEIKEYNAVSDYSLTPKIEKKIYSNNQFSIGLGGNDTIIYLFNKKFSENINHNYERIFLHITYDDEQKNYDFNSHLIENEKYKRTGRSNLRLKNAKSISTGIFDTRTGERSIDLYFLLDTRKAPKKIEKKPPTIGPNQ